ncbi:MAG: hypothetical protein ACXIU7_09055 [Roseinatronobacter sp.]
MTDHPKDTRGLRAAREIESELKALETFTPLALGVLAVASGIYTYIGVSSLLPDTGAMSLLAAIAYSLAVSVAIFVFWSYLIHLLPSLRSAAARASMFLAMGFGVVAILAMSSWLNAAALAGSAAVEQHLARTVQLYQRELEQANGVAVAAQSLVLDVARTRQGFQDLSEQEAVGNLSGTAGRGAVFRVLTQKADELAALESLILSQGPLVDAAFAEGNQILSRMRALTAASGAVSQRSIEFAEESVRLAGLIAQLRQLSVAPLVARAARDMAETVVLPQLDGATAGIRQNQTSTIDSVLVVLGQRAASLEAAAAVVMAMPAPAEATYAPITTADAVLRYASDFVPSWAGAIAIDMLPAVLVLIMMVAHGAIRDGRDPVPQEDLMTLADMRAALRMLREIETPLHRTEIAPEAAPETAARPAGPHNDTQENDTAPAVAPPIAAAAAAPATALPPAPSPLFRGQR